MNKRPTLAIAFAALALGLFSLGAQAADGTATAAEPGGFVKVAFGSEGLARPVAVTSTSPTSMSVILPSTGAAVSLSLLGRINKPVAKAPVDGI